MRFRLWNSLHAWFSGCDDVRPTFPCLRSRLTLCGIILALGFFSGLPCGAQAPGLIAAQVDTSQGQPLLHHHPAWATPANDTGSIAPAQAMEALTLVLARPAEEQQAFEQFLAEQQNPASPNYHHWLTPTEVGQRFGLSDGEIAAIGGWLQSQGLHIDWVAPSKIFIGFSGTAADVSRAFQTSLHSYRVNGSDRISVTSDPIIPAAVAPAVKAVHGLFTIDEQPLHISAPMFSDSPQMTTSSGIHFIGPGDFFTIYDLPNYYNGAGMTIGIVGRSRTNAADFDNFKALVGPNFTDPTEVVPTAYGGVDPGPALTAPPASGVSFGDQGEATLDVQRAGSVAPGARLLMVVATAASGGIGVDAQYLVNTTPLPAQVMSISFGACESAAGPSGVAFWDTLFQQAAAEGISSFVSSGDSGASGCDLAFQTPPAKPQANSPNYICSSAYATCVGGTQFNDTANPSQYWAIASGGPNQSALSYIPEGGWNESWNGTTSTVASSGGGVSAYVATPSWQKGVAGVPSANAGRYTPDVSFSSSSHDGYFACFAAGGGNCVYTSGSFYFSVFAGTSAAAPAMAGIAADLDQNTGGAQGNLNPGIYQMWVSAPTAFHDATPASSGVTSCSLNTPSMCNNSIPGPNGLSGGQPGYAVGTGYDQVTGLGSLDAATFVYAYATASKIYTPAISITTLSIVATNQPFNISVAVGGAPYSPAVTGTVKLTVGTYSSSAKIVPNTSGISFSLSAGILPVGDYTVSVTYTPDAASTPIYAGASASQPLSVIVPPKVSPYLALTTSQQIISNSQSLTVGVVVNAVQYYPTPTGSVTVTSGSYKSAPLVLTAASATFTIPAGSLAVGNDTLTVTYTPDAASASSYLVTSNFTYVENQGAKITPSVWVNVNPYLPTTADALTVNITVSGFTGNPTPTGTVVVTSGAYTSAAATLTGGNATIPIAAGALPPGMDTITATYTPDAQSSSLYSIAPGSNSVGITVAQKITPTLALTPLTSSPTTAQPLSLSITVAGAGTYPVPGGSVLVRADSFPAVPATLNAGRATVTLPPGSFTGGASTINAQYFPEANSSYIYNQASATMTVNVAKVTPTITVTALPAGASTTDALTVTVNVSGVSGLPQPGGQVSLTSGTYSSSQGYLALGATTIYVSPGSLLPGSDTLTATYGGDGDYSSATAATTVSVTAPANASFAIAGKPVGVYKGTSGGASKVTVTPANGFVGTVALTAAITGQPSGAQHLPTLSFGTTSSVTVMGFNPASTILSIATTPASSGALGYPPKPGAAWSTAGGVFLVCLGFFFAPAQRRRWLNLLGLLALLVFVAGSAASCGGGGQGGGGGGGGNPGTTSGQYIITITGASGSTTATTTITLDVQ